MIHLVVFMVIGFGLVEAGAKFIDLSHTFGHKNADYPFQPSFNFSLAIKIILKTTISVSNYYQTPEHSGTHMDAPNHFCPQGKFVHEVPLDKMSGPGVVLDFRSQADKDYDYQVSLQDVKDWEAKYGPIPKGGVVFLNFGWNKYWPHLEKVYNTKDLSNYSSYHFPGLGIEASDYIAGTRQVHAVGFDTPSADYAQTKTYPVHINLLCDHGLIILENVANLDAMPTTGSHVYVGAVKLENGSGTPVRVFATVGHDEHSAAGKTGFFLNLLISLMVIFISGIMIYMYRTRATQ